MNSKSMAVIVAAVAYAGFVAGNGTSLSLGGGTWLGDTVRVYDALPPGHPPIPSQPLPEGHPPLDEYGAQLPEGHPPIPWPRRGCPGADGGGALEGRGLLEHDGSAVIST